MKNMIIIILLLLATLLRAEEKSDFKTIPHYVWDSDSSNIGPTEIWFQDWTDYIRLFIKSTNGSISLTNVLTAHPGLKSYEFSVICFSIESMCPICAGPAPGNPKSTF